MVFDKHVAAITQIRTVLSVPLASLQYVVSWPIELFDKLHDTLNTHDSLVRENLDLKVEQLRLRAQVQRLLAIELENNQLKALMRSATQFQNKIIIAQLLAVSADPFLKQVIVDKGSRDNVFVGQPVLDANGVMGQVTQVDLLTSRVLLINDVHSGIAVQVARNGVRAIAVGDAYSDKLRLLNVPQTADIRSGDILMTSGLGEHFPEGYPVGQVTTVNKDPGLQFAMIAVAPAAHLDRSRGVLLVWPTNRVKL
ncbi:MAG: mreC [Gammaproteobacteria bacterium]|jgi:rod shape-determining protein MreC|nr:mreC [Gammaproteobacteria bacterium]